MTHAERPVGRSRDAVESAGSFGRDAFLQAPEGARKADLAQVVGRLARLSTGIAVVPPEETDRGTVARSRSAADADVSDGHFDDGLDLHGESERQCCDSYCGPGRPADAVAEGTDE